MATAKKTTKSGSRKRASLKVGDLKPSKDAKGGARHMEGATGRRSLNRTTKNLN